MAAEPVQTAAAWYRVCHVHERHRVLADVQGRDHGVGGGIDDVDLVRVLKADVDAGVIGAGPDPVRPIAVILDRRDQGWGGAAVVTVDESFVKPSDRQVRILCAVGFGDELRVVRASNWTPIRFSRLPMEWLSAD